MIKINMAKIRIKRKYKKVLLLFVLPPKLHEAYVYVFLKNKYRFAL